MCSKDISFSSRLKELRIIAGKTVAEVSSFLVCRGIKATDKTIYSWESGRSRPTADTLLLLCDFYGVSNVLSAFGYGKIENDGISFQLTPDERNLVSDYRELSEQGQEYIRQTMYMARQNFKKASASDDSAEL